MKVLEKQFEESGYTYEQIEKKGKFYIYKRTKPIKITKTKSFLLTEYEVVIPLIKKAFETNGYKYEAGEYYPGQSLWGMYGWSCMSLDRARKKLLEEKNKIEKYHKSRE